jgi:predicted O-linked N-acetylglucosamine transferase (SPINDLY family)
MGTDYIDHLITDRRSIKSGTESCYREKLIYLPEIALAAHSLSDSTHEHPTREALELPSDAFIFACLQSANRITPELFESWMRILSAAPDSILMLREGSPGMRENLSRAASSAGIAPERLIFTPTSTRADYLNRLSLADLCLDTYPWCSADPLSAGTPIVTIEGNSLSARQTAAALDHLGAVELIATDFSHYEQIAIGLARDIQKLTETKSRLVVAAKSATMFNGKKLADDWQKTLSLLVSG